jgi:phosphatidylglycerol---prolipoprotein diacylglyceryl transferase
MYPDLSYLLNDILPALFERDGAFSVVKMFGLLLAFAFLASAYTLGLEFSRKEEEGVLKPRAIKTIVGKPASVTDIATNAIVGFFVGFRCGRYYFFVTRKYLRRNRRSNTFWHLSMVGRQ